MSTLRKNGTTLQQQANGRWVTLGKLNSHYEMIVIERNRDTHLLKKFNGYGMSQEALYSGWFKNVLLTENNRGVQRRFYIPTIEFLSRGIPFKAKGYETQVVLTLETLEEYDIEKLKKEQDENGS